MYFPYSGVISFVVPLSDGVMNGNTISTRGQTVRLVGFDTPEAGMNARCEAERSLAARATRQLRQLIAGGGLDLSLVRCSCPVGTEGTPSLQSWPSLRCADGGRKRRCCGI